MPALDGRPAVFVDKDGTLVENVPYNADPALIRLLPGAGGALRGLQEAGYRVVVVTNQSGVALGYFPERAVPGIRRRVAELLAAYGVVLDGFYYCPHHPEAKLAGYRLACLCRKPAPGMLRRAAGELGIDLAGSWMVGDILDDVEAGRRAGCRAVLLDGGGETEWRSGPQRDPDVVVHTWREVSAHVLACGEHRQWQS